MAEKTERLLNSLHQKVECKLVEKWWKKSLNQVVDTNPINQLKEVFEVVFSETEKQFKIWTENATHRKGLAGVFRKVTPTRSVGEVQLERLTVTAKDSYFNQFNILSGLTKDQYDHDVKKMSVDLIETSGDDVIKMIELKDINNGENPLSALVQLVSYYHLFVFAHKCAEKRGIKYPGLAKRFKLQVLAPQGYYAKFKAEDENLKKIVKIAMDSINHNDRRLQQTKGDVEFLTFSRTDDDLQKIRKQLKEAIREFNKDTFIPFQLCK